MIPIGYFRDRTHGRRIPTGRPLANLTASVLHMAAADAIRQLRTRGHVNLQQWLPSFVQAATPIVTVFVREGQRQRAKELLAAIESRRRKSKSLVRKAFESWVSRTTFDNLSFGFDVFNPQVIEYIRTATYHFVESTLATAATDAEKAYAQVKQALGAKLQSGEGTQAINRAIYQIFRDPAKASRVGQTEAARAMAGGGYMLAHDVGVTTVRWLASSDACDICRDLNGQERELGTPFMINPKAKGPYKIILHSPAHPHCFCTETYIIDNAANVNEGMVAKLRLAAYDPGVVAPRFNRGLRLAASLRERL